MQTTEQSKTLAKNYNAVKENIKKACEQAGRLQEEVTLLAVSKTKPVDMLMDVYHAGARDFGENKVQELVDKIPQLPSDIRWHLIGHLQRNKVKYIVDKVYLIHSVDSLRLAEEISREAVKKQVEVNILIEVNVAQEESKFGTTTEETEKLKFVFADYWYTWLIHKELTRREDIKCLEEIARNVYQGDILLQYMYKWEDFLQLYIKIYKEDIRRIYEDLVYKKFMFDLYPEERERFDIPKTYEELMKD